MMSAAPAMLVSSVFLAGVLLASLSGSFTYIAAAYAPGDARLNFIAPEEIVNSSIQDNDAIETDKGGVVFEDPERRNIENSGENVDNEYNTNDVLAYSSSRRSGEDAVKSADKQLDSLEDSGELSGGILGSSGLNWGVPGGLPAERDGSCYDNLDNFPRKGVTFGGHLWGKKDKVPTVYYGFNNPEVSEERIQEAMDYYEKHTCLRFEKIGWFHFGSHVSYSRGAGCSSAIGYQFQNLFWGQRLSLSSGCSRLNIVIHEIGHAIGLYHEQSRSDRDGYVTIIDENIPSNKIRNFRKADTLNYNTIYDYLSVMHYGPLSFSKNGDSTIATNKPEYLGLLVKERTGMSFMDLLQVNTMYECSEYWLSECQVKNSSCQNLGYFGPDCVCICPEGTSGDNCETKDMEYTDALVKMYLQLNEKLTTPGTLTTPNYPAPQLAEVIFTKEIEAPSCQRVVLKVVGFDLHSRSSRGRCEYEGVEITLDASITGTWYCDKDFIPGLILESKGNVMVIFYAKGKQIINLHNGFSFDITFEPITGCVV